jgi:hypothetical protein
MRRREVVDTRPSSPNGRKPSAKRLHAFGAELMAKRPCGPCQACCTSLQVVEIGKPMAAVCQHQCTTGCGIYPTRPGSCRVYACAWKAAMIPGGDEMRPDQFRAIIDLEGGPGSRTHVRVWQLDAPNQIIRDARLRHAVYTLAMHLQAPVVAYYGDAFKSFHLIASLSQWRDAIARKFPGDPIYPLYDKGDLP